MTMTRRAPAVYHRPTSVVSGRKPVLTAHPDLR